MRTLKTRWGSELEGCLQRGGTPAGVADNPSVDSTRRFATGCRCDAQRGESSPSVPELRGLAHRGGTRPGSAKPRSAGGGPVAQPGWPLSGSQAQVSGGRRRREVQEEDSEERTRWRETATGAVFGPTPSRATTARVSPSRRHRRARWCPAGCPQAPPRGPAARPAPRPLARSPALPAPRPAER